MANLVFYDVNHTYTVDGVEVPSVSEITRFISRELYSEINQSFLDTAASRGTLIHKTTEVLDKFGTAEVPDEILPYIKAYMQFTKDISPEWEKIEWPVHNELLYAGTIDRYGTLNGKHVIVDIKSTAKISGGHKTLYTAAQNLYRMAVVKELPVDEIYILQLKNDGTYKLIQLDIQDELANACISLHYAMKKKKRTRKEIASDNNQ